MDRAEIDPELHILRASPAWLDAEEAPAPLGQPCARCEEPIAEGEHGWLIPHFDGFTSAFTSAFTSRPYHHACHIRGVIGSVGHLQGRCFCKGGTEEDPPNMTKREAAEAALALFEKQHIRIVEATRLFEEIERESTTNQGEEHADSDGSSITPARRR